MIYRQSNRFKNALQVLPVEIRNKVKKAFTLFQQDPRHPSLVIKKIQGYEGVWEGRIDQHYRFTFHFETDRKTDETICVFRNVDKHDECLRNP